MNVIDRGERRERGGDRWILPATLLLICVGLGPTLPAAGAPARPDRALYVEAQQAHATLQASKKLQARKAEWEKVVLRYRKVVARYPQSSYCDDALLAVGDLYRAMADRFKTPRYEDDAAQAYQNLVNEYPSSKLGDQALFSIFEMARDSADKRRIGEAARNYLDVFPDGKRAAEVKASVRKSAPERAAALPSPPPPGLTQVFNLRFWSGEASTRVVVDLEKEVPLKHDRLSGPDRLYVDLVGARLHPNLKDRSFPVGDGLLEQVRIGQNRDNVVRIVLDFRDVKDHNLVYLHDPTRLVIDVRGAPRPMIAGAPSPLPSPAGPTTAEAPAAETPTAEDRTDALPSRRVAEVLGPESSRPSPAAPKPVVIEGPTASPSPGASPGPASGSRTARVEPVTPTPPRANRTGSFSIARQLGLGARKILIDPGHGGHDPGTIGAGGLQEKDLVLDVACRLEKLVRTELGADVLMTRSTDVFIPLEERTAIANSKGADLFLSIHANSSYNPSARGIETYFLNFAQSPHAEAVAARENAISAATLKDLQGLVRAITLNSKIDESRDFAASVQEAMVQSLKPEYPDVLDRGVHTAPFYVLIGANMPSVLAEIAFVSNPEDERRLKASDFRDRIARSLLEGVRVYLESLNRQPPRQLTGSVRRTTVASRGSRR